MKVLEGLFYTKDHEWIKVDGDKAYLGITDYAQKALGNLVYIELPEIDTELNAGDTFGTLESVKAASDSFIPVDGTILEINDSVVDDPSLVNQDAYENWLICFKILNESQLDGLMQAGEYKEFCSKED